MSPAAAAATSSSALAKSLFCGLLLLLATVAAAVWARSGSAWLVQGQRQGQGQEKGLAWSARHDCRVANNCHRFGSAWTARNLWNCINQLLFIYTFVELQVASCLLSVGSVAAASLCCRVASCANSVALSHRAFPFGFLSLPPSLPLFLFSSLHFLPLPSSCPPPPRQLITYFPKINMHCKLRCKTHLRAALPTSTAAAATATALHLRLSNGASRRQLWQCQCQLAGASPVIVNRSVCVHATLL